MNTSRSIKEILKEIRDAYSEERQLDGAPSDDAVPFRSAQSSKSPQETRWDIDQLTVVWPSSNPKRERLIMRAVTGKLDDQVS